MGRDNMGQKIKPEDWDNVKKIRDYIKIAKITITCGLIWEEVENIKLQCLEYFGEHKVYVMAYQIVDCDVNTGVEESRKDKIYRYIIIKDDVKSLEGYIEEKRLKSKKRKRRIFI